MASRSRWIRSCRVAILDIASLLLSGAGSLRTGQANAKRRRLGERPSGSGKRARCTPKGPYGEGPYDVDELLGRPQLLRVKRLPQGTSWSQPVASGSAAPPGTQRTFANESWNARSV